MQYLIDESTRNALLEYFEGRESTRELSGEFFPNEEAQYAAFLRDLKPLREVA